MKITLTDATKRIQKSVGTTESGTWDSKTASAVIRKLENLSGFFTQLDNIEKQGKNIMSTQAEQTAKLNAIGDKLDKASKEIIAAIEALKAAQANAGNTTAEEDAATDRLDKAAQALDDINPDAPAPTP